MWNHCSKAKATLFGSRLSLALIMLLGASLCTLTSPVVAKENVNKQDRPLLKRDVRPKHPHKPRPPGYHPYPGHQPSHWPPPYYPYGYPYPSHQGIYLHDDIDGSDLVTAGITAIAVGLLLQQLDISVIHYRALPPGTRKNLARGKPLPPGLAKRHPPERLVPHLPHHQGYHWLVAGTDLLLIHTASDIIADVLVDAIR